MSTKGVSDPVLQVVEKIADCDFATVVRISPEICIVSVSLADTDGSVRRYLTVRNPWASDPTIVILHQGESAKAIDEVNPFAAVRSLPLSTLISRKDVSVKRALQLY